MSCHAVFQFSQAEREQLNHATPSQQPMRRETLQNCGCCARKPLHTPGIIEAIPVEPASRTLAGPLDPEHRECVER